MILLLTTVGIMIPMTLIGFPWLLGPCPYDLLPVEDTTYDFVPRKIAFGSCLSNKVPPNLLDKIQADVFVFLGDNVYADCEIKSEGHLKRLFNWLLNKHPYEIVAYKQFFYKLSCKPQFQRLVKRTKYIISTWDDHDYGKNDAGAEFSMKYTAQETFLDFWRIPTSSERHRKDGIYGAYRFSKDNTSILIVVPDLRFFRDPIAQCTQSSNYYCASNGTMLGAKQWKWLENTLTNDNSDLIIIASSTQFVSEEYGYESWGNFPNEKRRLTNMLNPNKTIIISGDLHWGEISMSKEGLYDITSSGISMLDTDILPNSHRVGQPLAEFNFGLLDLDSMTVTVQSFRNNISLQLNTINLYKPLAPLAPLH
jgi:alkaline phosphatase D